MIIVYTCVYYKNIWLNVIPLKHLGNDGTHISSRTTKAVSSTSQCWPSKKGTVPWERDGKGMLIQGEKEKISDLLNEREQHQKCKQWRTAYKRSKERNGTLRNLTTKSTSWTLKRTADRLVAEGRYVRDAQELYKGLHETITSVKLFCVKSADVERGRWG